MSDAGTGMTHEQLALAPAYALGALDDDERAAFEAHLATCDACAAEVRAHAEVAALLPYALVDEAPPASLRARVLAAAQPEVRAIGSAPSARATVPAAITRRAAAWPGWLAAAAALLLAAGLGMRLGDERRARQLAEGALAAERATVAQRDALLASVLAPEARTARLTSTGQGPDVRLVWNRREGVVVLTAQALAPAPAGRTYQLWGIATGGQPQSLGLFDADSTGHARAVLRVPANAAMEVAAITVEPAGGSPGPTTTPVLTGRIGTE